MERQRHQGVGKHMETYGHREKDRHTGTHRRWALRGGTGIKARREMERDGGKERARGRRRERTSRGVNVECLSASLCRMGWSTVLSIL